MAKIRLRTDLQVVVRAGQWGQLHAVYGHGKTTYVINEPNIHTLDEAQRRARHIYDDLKGGQEQVVEGVVLGGDVLGADGVLDLAA